MKKANMFRRLLVWVPLIGLCAVVALVALPLFTLGYVDAMLRGPKIVASVPSPDGEFTAYVEEGPSIDPPNQSLWVERSDKLHAMLIAGLTEDVDSIKKILWSPDSRIVVFHSHHYLTATRVSDWQTVRIYLGSEWRRFKPDRRSTFTSGGVRRHVKSIEFPEADVISYCLEGDENVHEVRLAPEVKS